MNSNDITILNSTKIVFAGSGNFAVPQIIALQKKIRNLKIITQKSREGTAVKNKIASPFIIEVSGRPDFEKKIKELSPELLIVSDFGIILSKEALKIPKKVINTHPSLLPKYRGSSPYVTALLKGDKETGVSIIEMSEGIDSGPIYTQEKLKIDPKDNQNTLRDKLSDLAADMLLSSIINILNDELKAKPQNEDEATYTRMFKKEDGKIDWNESAITIERKIRAFNPWPGTYTFFETPNKTIRVKILDADIETRDNLKPRRIIIENGSLKIKTKEGFLVIKALQPEGKKEMNITDFLKGYKVISVK